MSVSKGTGFDAFKKMFKESIIKLYSFNENKDFYVTSPRHYEIFIEMREIVKEVLEKKPQTEELLFALNDLISLYDKLIGRNVSQDDIDKIFSRFCIGK
jgi:tRNA U34 5-carboxymethylaminomethyl modifying GTPase MnmE/TrmE